MAVPSTLLLACGALAKEVIALIDANRLDDAVTVDCLPASLHHKPALIPDALRERLQQTKGEYDQIIIGYGDCGTSGEIDDVCLEFGATRIPGEHCFEFYAGSATFAALHEAELGTFYLTDFFARHFDLFVLEALGITAHPELETMYFGNYKKVVYLSQDATPALLKRARAAADRLGLAFEHVSCGYGELATTMVSLGPHTKR